MLGGWLDGVDEDDAIAALHRVGERPEHRRFGFRAGVHHDHDPPPDDRCDLSLFFRGLGLHRMIGRRRRRHALAGRRGADPDASGDAVEAEAGQAGGGPAAAAHRRGCPFG